MVGKGISFINSTEGDLSTAERGAKTDPAGKGMFPIATKDRFNWACKILNQMYIASHKHVIFVYPKTYTDLYSI